MDRIFRTFIKAGGGATCCWKPEANGSVRHLWSGLGLPSGVSPLASGGVSLTVWWLSSSWAEACNPGAGFTLSRSLLSPSGDKGCYLSSPELRYLPAQETATSSKRAQWRGTGIGGLRPNFLRVEYSNGVPVESSDFQLLKAVWSA